MASEIKIYKTPHQKKKEKNTQGRIYDSFTPFFVDVVQWSNHIMTPKARMFTKNQGCQVRFKEHRPTNNKKSNKILHQSGWTFFMHLNLCNPTERVGRSLPLEGTHVSLARWKHKKMGNN